MTDTIHQIEGITTQGVTFPRGFRAAGVRAGISAVEGKKDIALVVNDGPVKHAAAVFTSNRFAAAPVLWSQQVISDGRADAVLLGRELLRNPFWARHAAGALGGEVHSPVQYHRA